MGSIQSAREKEEAEKMEQIKDQATSTIFQLDSRSLSNTVATELPRFDVNHYYLIFKVPKVIMGFTR